MKKKIFSYIGVFIAIFLIVLVFKAARFYSAVSTHKESWGQKIPQEKTEFNVLVMGYGGPGHDGAYLTDTIMLLHANLKTKKALFVSLPRDIWVKIPTESGADFNRKINSVYQMGLFPKNYPDLQSKYKGEDGAGQLLKKVVQDITGLHIDYYIAIDFTGFKKAVDTLGGVDIVVANSFTDSLYPIDGNEEDLCGTDPNDLTKLDELEKIATESPELAYPCRYETLQFESGEQHMDGATALKFVRSRHSAQDGGDFGRAKRQQLFLEATKDKILSIGFIPKVIPLLDDLEDNVRMDVPLDLVNKFIKEAPQANKYTTTPLVITTDNYLKSSYSDDRQYILIPKAGMGRWTVLKKDISKILAASPSPTIKK